MGKYKDNIKKTNDTKPLNERIAEARAKNEEEDEAGINQNRKTKGYRETKGIKYRETKGNELSARYKTKLILFNLCCIQQERKANV